jgi:hypothetical protein
MTGRVEISPTAKQRDRMKLDTQVITRVRVCGLVLDRDHNATICVPVKTT